LNLEGSELSEGAGAGANFLCIALGSILKPSPSHRLNRFLKIICVGLEVIQIRFKGTEKGRSTVFNHLPQGLLRVYVELKKYAASEGGYELVLPSKAIFERPILCLRPQVRTTNQMHTELPASYADSRTVHCCGNKPSLPTFKSDSTPFLRRYFNVTLVPFFILILNISTLKLPLY
jgi:hypothetical protein